MEKLKRMEELAKRIDDASLNREQGARALLDIELVGELSTTLRRVTDVIATSAQTASEDLAKLRSALDAVVRSMDKSTETMAWLTRWLIAAATVSALAAIVQVILLVAKKG